MKELLNKSDQEVSEIKQKMRLKDNDLAERTQQIDMLREDLDAKEHVIFDMGNRHKQTEEARDKNQAELLKKNEKLNLLQQTVDNLKFSLA